MGRREQTLVVGQQVNRATGKLLAPNENLFDFFHEQVETASREAGVTVSADLQYYLSQLLVERGRAPEEASEKTLVELHLQAVHAERPVQIRCYKDMGDQALYTAGFFPDRLRKRAVTTDYYVSMGRTAYEHLAHLLSGWGGSGRGFEAIFAELADAFADCAALLQEVREQLRGEPQALDDAAILRLYEDWLSTGNPRALRKLQAAGLSPARPKTDGLIA